MTMIKKFVQIPNSEDNNYAHDGEITDVCGGYVLVRMRNVVDGPPHSRLFPLADVAAGFVFENREELMAWLEWEPEQPAKILPFEKR